MGSAAEEENSVSDADGCGGSSEGGTAAVAAVLKSMTRKARLGRVCS